MEKDELERELEGLHPESFGWAMACCRRNREDAEEVLQSAYLKILEGRARFEGRSSLKTWLFGVIRITSVELRRRNFFRLRRFSSEAGGIAPPDPRPGPEAAAEEGQRRAQLLGALDHLARRQREVLQLVFYHGLTIREAASALEISLGSARTHYERAKRNLARELEKRGLR